MNYLYNSGLIIFRILLILVSPFNSKAKLWINGRKNILKRISESISKDEKRIWIHVSSLGEFEQGRPILETIKKDYPEYKIMLTFFSPSGYEVRKDYELADYVFYLPDDTPKNAENFIKIVQPEMVLFIKYEYWFNYLSTLKKNNIATYMASSIFREDHIFFKWYGGWYRKMLKTISYFFVQNQKSKELLNNIGFQNVSVSGDTRFDRVYEISKQTKTYSLIEKFKENSNILIAGSSWKPDEEILIDYINTADNSWKYIIAPHEIHQRNINRIESLLKRRTVRYSKANPENAHNFDVLIVDNIGMLSSLYQYGNIAYIGGGFSTGIHNILEAATFGLPVIFGPDYTDFQEAHDLIEIGGAYTINNQDDFNDIIEKLITNHQLTKEKGGICKSYIEQSRGATDTLINHVFNN